MKAAGRRRFLFDLIEGGERWRVAPELGGRRHVQSFDNSGLCAGRAGRCARVGLIAQRAWRARARNGSERGNAGRSMPLIFQCRLFGDTPYLAARARVATSASRRSAAQPAPPVSVRLRAGCFGEDPVAEPRCARRRPHDRSAPNSRPHRRGGRTSVRPKRPSSIVRPRIGNR